MAADSIPWSWRLRKRFWTRWQTTRHRLSKPQVITPPKPNGRAIRLVPLAEAQPKIPIREVKVYEKLPKEEARLAMRVLVAAGLWLTRVVPQMKPGLPQIAAAEDDAVDFGVARPYRKAYRPLVRPAPFDGADSPDLGSLATASPYAVLTESRDGQIQWDFEALGGFEHHDGLCSLALRVLFDPTPERTLVATKIESDELGTVAPGDADWSRAIRLAVGAATTQMALTRHFNYVHLISGNHWDVVARNELPIDHPVYRLLWPHIFNSLYTNHGVTRPQLLPDGDFVNVFSFTHAGLCSYYDAMHLRYDIDVTDPEADWARRGLSGAAFDSPTHANLVDLFTVMHDHATRYLDAYYPTDDDLRRDRTVSEWLAALDELVPNGLELPGELTKAWLARRIGGYIYEGNTIHDMAGTTLWDYQLWPDHNPTRVYRDGRRVPVDVYQRAINNNFALQLRRAPMLADYGHIALDSKGASLFARFFDDCTALQERYDRTPAGPWRMEPKNLEINMNG